METFPDSSHVEVELLVSGVCTMAAVIPASWRVWCSSDVVDLEIPRPPNYYSTNTL